MSALLFAAWVSIASHASDCEPLEVVVEQAWAYFDDAELAEAERLVESARDLRRCQVEVVSKETLLRLHHLDALVAITLDDREAAQAATIRAVAVDAELEAPAFYGPELVELHDQWRQRLSLARITVTVRGGGVVYVDGMQVTEAQSLRVIPGEHLIQVQEDDLIMSTVSDIESDQIVHTGLPSEQGVKLESWDAPDASESTPSSESTDRPIARRHGLGWYLAGGALVAGGAGVGALTYQEEKAFLARRYNAAQYGGCDRSQRCWLAERDQQIFEDARAIDRSYVAGYSLIGLGVGVSLVGVVGLPIRTDGNTLQFYGRW